MRQVSEYASNLLRRLNAKPLPGDRLAGQSGSKVAILQELGRCDEPAVIPYLLPVLAFGTKEEINTGAIAVATLLNETSIEDLVWLDEWTRGSWIFNSGYQHEWCSLAPRELARWVGPGEPGTLLLRLSSFHGNGFLREEAVRRLSLLDDGSELPYLLLRLNDWVYRVRQTAYDAVAARITPEYIGHFVRSLALVVRLERVQRADLRGLLDRINLLLSSADAAPALVEAMRSGHTETRRASFRFLVSGEPEDLVQRLRIALRVGDPVIRLRAAVLAVDRWDQNQLPALLDTLWRDAAAPVRLEALVAWVNRFPEQAGGKLMDALRDPSASVRGQARYYIRQRGGLDIASVYRDALAAALPEKLVVTLSGIAETGGPADAAHIAPYLTHPSAKVRRTAIRGVMTLAGDRYVRQVLERLFDDSSSVSRQAAKFLEPHAAGIGTPTLWALFEVAPSTHVRQNLLRLVAAMPKWESIGYMVRAAASGDLATAALAREYVRRWNARFNQNQTAATGEQVARLAAALTVAGGHLDERELASLRFTVRACGKA
ncbi:MAG TPA: hypothetical protein VD973_10915 [Symbiobacteriaceae bacterium]|nr:hypothetical protein [Symbiobacteriaceae bacterium]